MDKGVNKDKQEVEKVFNLILAEAENEDYEQCSANALNFIFCFNEKCFDNQVEAELLLPYVRYFKLFSEAYRTWQISYDYTPIRSRFRLASIALKNGLEDQSIKIEGLKEKAKKAADFNEKTPEELAGHKKPAELTDDEKLFLTFIEQNKALLSAFQKQNRVLLPAFENLSEMLCEYTKCENSFINNDPFALKHHSGQALEFEGNVLGKNLPSLERQTGKIEEIENKALDSLSKDKTEVALKKAQTMMAGWLISYLTTNQYLHEGLNGCARLYIKLLSEQSPWTPTDTADFSGIEEITLKTLCERSPELSSELNAHVRHIKNHNQRLVDEPRLELKKKGFLRITKGSLVIQMSAAFEAELAHQLFSNEDKQREFKQEIDDEFKALGVKASSYQMKQLHDVFQTSFGEKLLKEMSFDIWKEREPEEIKSGDINEAGQKSEVENDDETDKEITVKILNEDYSFDIKFSFSALGVCTLYFILDIDNLTPESDQEEGEKGGGEPPPHEDDSAQITDDVRLRKPEAKGLRVEEARVIQSLLCPHAGQVEIQDAMLSQEKVNNFQFLKRIEISDLYEFAVDFRRIINDFEPENKSLLEDRVGELESALEEIEKKWLKESKDSEKKYENAEGLTDLLTSSEEIVKAADEIERVTKAIDAIKEATLNSGLEALEKKVGNLINRLDEHHYLVHVADQYLDCIEAALKRTLPDRINSLKDKTEKVLNRATDTGWFTYLYCREIERVRMNGKETVVHSFEEIIEHPDLLGFVLEQREARASFDDWRFTKPLNLQNNNLAQIRSHLSDGFFCSEYQAFIYFPDDPMFLTDQYEATVKLMVRLATVLRYISRNASVLAERIHTHLFHRGGMEADTNYLKNSLDEIRQLRLEAKELKTLVARAAISRYKDHGDLMKRILSEMKLDQMADLLDEQLQYLGELHTDILRKIEDQQQKDESIRQAEEEKRQETANFAITILAAVVGLSALHDAAETLFWALGIDNKMIEGWVTIGLIIPAAYFLRRFYKQRMEAEKSDQNQ